MSLRVRGIPYSEYSPAIPVGMDPCQVFHWFKYRKSSVMLGRPQKGLAYKRPIPLFLPSLRPNPSLFFKQPFPTSRTPSCHQVPAPTPLDATLPLPARAAPGYSASRPVQIIGLVLPAHKSLQTCFTALLRHSESVWDGCTQAELRLVLCLSQEQPERKYEAHVTGKLHCLPGTEHSGTSV